MSELKNKTIITVATTGAWPTKANNPNVPMTPEEISEDVYACWKAGAAIAHLHMRDDEGHGTMDKEKFRKTVELLRARYNSSLIDANVTEPGDEYEKLNETYVIFITEHDVLGGGQPIYHVDRTIKETGALFGDESHILYVNAQIKDDTALGQLMHDFSCTSAEQMHYQIDVV